MGVISPVAAPNHTVGTVRWGRVVLKPDTLRRGLTCDQRNVFAVTRDQESDATPVYRERVRATLGCGDLRYVMEYIPIPVAKAEVTLELPPIAHLCEAERRAFSPSRGWGVHRCGHEGPAVVIANARYVIDCF